jgi:NTE family protein
MAEVNYLVNKYSLIDNLPLFSKLSYFQKKSISAKSQIYEIKKGDIVYREGDPPDFFYCIVSGRIEVYHAADKARKRQRQRIDRLRRGDYFGSISSLTGQPHTLSAKALNDSVVLRINTKDFNDILHKCPKLAIFLSHSLSRRLSQKRHKEIFVSTIIAVYGQDASSYTAALADALRKESGKKALVIKSSSIPYKKDVASKLSLFTEDYHYVLVEIPEELNSVNLEILKQSDICHILCSSGRRSLSKTSLLVKRLDSTFSKYTERAIFIILKEDNLYPETSYENKVKVLTREVFATLSRNRTEYKKTIRRIARDISGVMVGLALGSGAAMGIAQIGIIKVLEKEKIPIDAISASSIGALIGALWASGLTAAELEQIAFKFKSKLKTVFLADPTLPVRGLIKGRAVRKFLESHLGNKTFYDLKMPLKIVACDIKNRKEIVIDSGSLVDAVMASIAIPGVFEPAEYDGIQLIDGGIVNPVPVSVLSKLGIKRIIAVNTLPSPEDAALLSERGRRFNIYDVIVNSFQEMEYALAMNSCQQADVYMHPIPKNVCWYEFFKAQAFVKTGQEHARRMLPEIKKLAR